MAVYHITIKKDKTCMRRYIFSDNFFNKTTKCVSAFGICAAVGLVQLCYYACFQDTELMGSSTGHRHLSSLLEVATVLHSSSCTPAVYSGGR